MWFSFIAHCSKCDIISTRSQQCRWLSRRYNTLSWVRNCSCQTSLFSFDIPMFFAADDTCIYTFMGWELFLQNIFVVAFCSSLVWQFSLLHHIQNFNNSITEKKQQSFNKKIHSFIIDDTVGKHNDIFRQLMFHNHEIIKLDMLLFVATCFKFCEILNYPLSVTVSTHQSWQGIVCTHSLNAPANNFHCED